MSDPSERSSQVFFDGLGGYPGGMAMALDSFTKENHLDAASGSWEDNPGSGISTINRNCGIINLLIDLMLSANK